MRIKDVILDYISGTSLFEMAFERKIAINKARNTQHQITRHLVKMFMYDKSQYTNHWKSEINGWLRDIQSTVLKNTKRPLDRDTLFKILFIEPLQTIDEVQWLMNDSYHDYPNLTVDEPDAAKIHKKLLTVIDDVSSDISFRKFNDIKEYL